MSFCTKCGQKLEDEEQKCTNCGDAVGQVVEDNEPMKWKNKLYHFNNPLRSRKILTIFIVVLILVGIGSITYSQVIKPERLKHEISLGNKYLQEGNYEEAILAFQKVIQIDPKNIEARVGLAKVYIKIAKLDEAENILKEAISIDPKKVEPYLELAKLYIGANNPVNAINILNDGYKATNDESIKSMLEDLKLKITVDDINKTIALGENYSLPSEVTVKIDNIEVLFPVKWDKTTVDVSTAGTQKITGTLENTDKTFKLILNIIGIESIEDINSKIMQNDKYSLPAKVTAKMTDGSTQDVDITWNPSTVDTSKAENHSYEGTVSGYSNKVKLTLNIQRQGIRLGELRKQLFGDKYALQGNDLPENIPRQEFENNDKYRKYDGLYFVSVGSMKPKDSLSSTDDNIVEPDMVINGKSAYKVYYRPLSAYYTQSSSYGVEIADVDGKMYSLSEIQEAIKNNKASCTSGEVLTKFDQGRYYPLEW